MFRTAAPGRQRTAESFSAAIEQWRSTSDSWFDGTFASVDNRLRRCAKLIQIANAAVGRDPMGSGQRYLNTLRELSADKQVIAELREDLLTGGSGREAGVPSGRTANGLVDDAASWVGDNVQQPVVDGVSSAANWVGENVQQPIVDKLGASERRWVELEASRFIAANTDVAHVPDELSERAGHHAQDHTSRLGQKRSKVVTAAFIAKVVALGRAVPRPRVAAAPTTMSDFDPALMFLA